MYGHQRQYGRPATPKVINFCMLGLKIFSLVALMITLILSAVIPGRLTADHVWNCNDSPENECARLMLVPIFLNLGMILYDIGCIVLIALGVMHLAFVIADGILTMILAIALNAIAYTLVLKVVFHFKWREMTTMNSTRSDDHIPLRNCHWLIIPQVSPLALMAALLVTVFRMIQACRIAHPLPVPETPLVTMDCGPMVTNFGPAEQMEPIEPISKEENSGPIKR